MSPADLVLTPRGLRHRGRLIPAGIGRGGRTRNKREGDGATPIGTHRITGCLYRADRIARPCAWARPIGPGDLWSDDPADPAYNRLVTAPHGHSHERLRRGDRLYDLILLTDWNAEGVPGRGSAIFVHRWRGRGVPTAGCVAMAPGDLAWLVARIRPGTRLILR